MELIPILEHIESNGEFTSNPDCAESIFMSVEFYKKVGFDPPWIGYYVKLNGSLVGTAAFKGKPVNRKVEIAYGTFPMYRNKGIGAKICRQLVQLSLKTDPAVKITARTLAEENFSAKILRKNGFHFLGSIVDEEDGEVWEWGY